MQTPHKTLLLSASAIVLFSTTEVSAQVEFSKFDTYVENHFREMMDMYNNADMEHTSPALKYGYVDYDWDGTPELLIASADERDGAIFSLVGKKPKEITQYTPQQRFVTLYGEGDRIYLYCGGAAGGPAYYHSYIKIGKSVAKEESYATEVYGELDSFIQNGKDKSAADYAIFKQGLQEVVIGQKPSSWKIIGRENRQWPMPVVPLDDNLATFTPAECINMDDTEHINAKAARNNYIFFKQNAAGVGYDDKIYTRDASLFPTMFRGYERYEIVALATDENYMDTHYFPAYRRWKDPETKELMSDEFNALMETTFGHPVLYSQRVAMIKESGTSLILVEFKIEDRRAGYAYVWYGEGDVMATFQEYTMLQEDVDENDPQSVWNIDDDGTYGAPGVIGLTVDAKDYTVDLYLTHHAPESCTFLHYWIDPERNIFTLIDTLGWYPL